MFKKVYYDNIPVNIYFLPGKNKEVDGTFTCCLRIIWDDYSKFSTFKDPVLAYVGRGSKYLKFCCILQFFAFFCKVNILCILH